MMRRRTATHTRFPRSRTREARLEERVALLERFCEDPQVHHWDYKAMDGTEVLSDVPDDEDYTKLERRLDEIECAIERDED